MTEAGWLLIDVFGFFLSTVNVRFAGVASTLPNLSTAATAKVCLPSLSFAVVYGEEHAVKSAPSTEQRKVEPASLDVKVNFTCRFETCDPFFGPEVMVVSGAAASQVLILMSSMNQP